MKINGTPTRTIWPAADGSGDVEIFDQTLLPHRVEVVRLKTLDDAARAIKDMLVRGAPLIGATAAYGLCLALRQDIDKADIEDAARTLKATRPTAVNLAWAVDRMLGVVLHAPPSESRAMAYAEAARICDEDVEAWR
jgi:methylthioribose-1-phosphate isomerase